jgi:hypothetical protein
MKLEISLRFFEKYSNMKFHENPSNGNRVIYGRTKGQTDRRTDVTNLIVAFRNFLQFCVFRTRLKSFVKLSVLIPACTGRAMPQAVSRRPHTAEAYVQSQTIQAQCGNCTQSVTGICFFPPRILRFFHVNIIPRLPHTLSSVADDT